MSSVVIRDLPARFRLHLAAEELDSTNLELRRVVEAGRAEDGLVVIAAHQTRGSGRLGRTWESPPGNLYLSFLRRAEEAWMARPAMAQTASLAVGTWLQEVVGLKPDLKWPNDVLYQGRKLAGILAAGLGDWQIIGIGLNLVGLPDSAPAEVLARAVSLEDLTGVRWSPDTAAAGILSRLEPLERAHVQSGGLDRAAWLSLWGDLGQQVRVETPGDDLLGRVVDLTEFGQLVLETDAGSQVVSSGEIVRLRRT